MRIISWATGAQLASVVPMAAATTLTAGLLFGLSLIVAIGAQNSFVLRVGMQRQHLVPVVVICTVSDVVLIAAGVAGAGAALRAHPGLLQWVRLCGAAFLIWYGLLAARRALRPAAADLQAPPPASLAATVLTTLALTWLNPGVYLDTIVLLGSVAHTRAEPWWFGAGAAVASILWFGGLGLGARLLSVRLRRPGTWRALDGFVAVVMATTAVRVVAS